MNFKGKNTGTIAYGCKETSDLMSSVVLCNSCQPILWWYNNSSHCTNKIILRFSDVFLCRYKYVVIAINFYYESYMMGKKCYLLAES
jgi:hypothetical protein